VFSRNVLCLLCKFYVLCLLGKFYVLFLLGLRIGSVLGRSLGRFATNLPQHSERTHAQQDQYEVERRATKEIKGGANQAVLMSE